jgi:hypothetical protein
VIRQGNTRPQWLTAVAAVLLTTAAVRAADADYLPDGTQLVVAVHLKQIFNAEVVKAQPDAVPDLKAVLGQFVGVDDIEKYTRLVGTDVYHDVSRITVALTGTTNLRPEVVVLTGEFDLAKLEAAAKAGNGVRLAKTGTPAIYELAPRGEKPRFAALVNARTLVLTLLQPVAEAIDQKEASRTSIIGTEFARWESSHAGEPSLTVVARGTCLARIITAAGLPDADRAAAFLKSLDLVSGSMTLAKGIQFQLSCAADSEDVARKLTDSANSAQRMLLTYVRQTAEKEPRYRPVIDVVAQLQFIAQAKRITLRGELTLDTIEKLIASFPTTPPERK